MSDIYTSKGTTYRKLHQEWILLRRHGAPESDYESDYVTVESSAGTLVLCNEVELMEGDHRGFHSIIPVLKTELRSL